MPNELRNFLALSYDELEDLNLEAKEQRKNRVPIGKIQEKRLKYLADEKRIKALTVLFTATSTAVLCNHLPTSFLLTRIGD